MIIRNRLCNLLGALAISLASVACSTSGSDIQQQEVVYVDEEGNTINPSDVDLNEYEVVEEQTTDTSTAIAEEFGIQDESQNDSVAIEMDSSTESELRDMLSGIQEPAETTELEEMASMAEDDTQEATGYESVAMDSGMDAADEPSYVELNPARDTEVGMDSSYTGSDMATMNTDGMKSYIIQRGDTLSKISMRIYGTFSRWNELAQVNNISNPDLIYAGDVVYYDGSQATETFSQVGEPTSEVVVSGGDTLSSISKRIYGTPNNWKYLANVNKITNPNRIAVGTRLVYESMASIASTMPKTAPEASSMNADTNVNTTPTEQPAH